MTKNISSLHAATYFHDVVDIGGRFYTDRRELETEPGYLMRCEVNNIILGGGLVNIMKCVSDTHNANG